MRVSQFQTLPHSPPITRPSLKTFDSFPAQTGGLKRGESNRERGKGAGLTEPQTQDRDPPPLSPLSSPLPRVRLSSLSGSRSLCFRSCHRKSELGSRTVGSWTRGVSFWSRGCNTRFHAPPLTGVGFPGVRLPSSDPDDLFNGSDSPARTVPVPRRRRRRGSDPILRLGTPGIPFGPVSLPLLFLRPYPHPLNAPFQPLRLPTSTGLTSTSLGLLSSPLPTRPPRPSRRPLDTPHEILGSETPCHRSSPGPPVHSVHRLV